MFHVKQAEICVYISFKSMSEAPKDRPIFVITSWNQTGVVIFDRGRWRYGPKPGDTWDGDYPVGWVEITACEWPIEVTR